ncbi:MAG TPA: molybdate ABC transporter substrate-binding protein [Acidimicrobiales bacterium]|jgi:molybdate transport system substrate-binding protein|nr:molybdate ABC transporter substrate-binding protein [Acidimicrobiales bacterium]
MSVRRSLLALFAGIALLLAACGSSGGSEASDTTKAPSSGGGATTTEAPLEGEITVSAAASLTESFTDIGAAFEEEHPGTKVTFTFDSSGTLSQQILDGAPVDVFASADEKNMEKLTDAGLVKGEPAVFAQNQLVIVTKPGNPEGIESLADLADAGIISLCGEDVPCGKFAGEALENAGVTIPEGSVTRGQNVKATLAAVTEGDAVAGIVYVTDAIAAGDAVDTVAIPADENVIATYPVAVLTDTQDAALASAFVDYVSSEEGQAVLEERGFLPPA